MIQKNQSTSPLTDYMFYKAENAGVPISVTFEVTPMCNFSCKMCYVRKTLQEVQENTRGMRSLEQWMTLAEETYKRGSLFVLLTGGEPTLWPDFWTFYENLVKMGFFVSINTNGSTLNEKAIKILKRYPPRRLNITLYGASDETYEKLCGINNIFKKVDHAINELCEMGIQVKLNCSLTPDNVCDLEKMISYAQERKLILDVATYMFPPLRRNESMIGENERFSPAEAARYRLLTYRLQQGEERYKNYLKNILNGCIEPPGLDDSCVDPIDGKIRCRAGKASYWLTWDGWMTPCGMMNEPRIDTENGSLKKAWEDLRSVSNQMTLSGVCANCSNIQICHSCAAMAQTETGNVSGIPKYLCQMVQEMKNIAKIELEKGKIKGGK